MAHNATTIQFPGVCGSATRKDNEENERATIRTPEPTSRERGRLQRTTGMRDSGEELLPEFIWCGVFFTIIINWGTGVRAGKQFNLDGTSQWRNWTKGSIIFCWTRNINVFICGGFVNDCGISKSGRVMFLRPHRLFRTVATYNDNVKKGFVINSRIRVEPKGEMRTPSSSQSRKERSRNLEVSKGTNTRELNCSRINRVCVCISSKGPTRRVPPVWLPPSLDLTFVGDIIGFNL